MRTRLLIHELLLVEAKDESEHALLLGIAYLYGFAVKKNEQVAVQHLSRAAESGMRFAQHYLGECYYAGAGVKEDHKKAFEWFLRAANAGLAIAAEVVAEFYAKGTGTNRDQEKAIYYYELAAKRGSVKALVSLGLFLTLEGVGEQASLWKRAKDCFEEAAQKGSPLANQRIADCYRDGTYGFPKDAMQARQFADEANRLEQEQEGHIRDTMLEAARSGHIDSQIVLAEAYRRGVFGLGQDAKKADYWDARGRYD